MKLRTSRIASLGALAGLVAATGAALALAPTAAPAAEFDLKTVAITRSVPQWALFEFFKKEVEKRSGGRIAITLSTNGEMNLSSFDMVQILKSGVIDIGNIIPLHVSGTLPLVEGTELPGLFPDVKTNRKAFDAWTQKVLLPNAKLLGGRVIGSFGWSGQMLFSRKNVQKLSDLHGMKIRVTSRSMSDYIHALGGVPVTISLDELYTGLQQGTVGGATTAAATGYQLRLWENTKYLVDLDIGTPTGLLVVNNAVWAKLPPDLQKVLTEVGKEFTNRGWDMSMTLGEKGIKENESKGVTYIPAKPAWSAALHAAQMEVAQKWAERAGATGKADFNRVLSPYTGFKLQ